MLLYPVPYMLFKTTKKFAAEEVNILTDEKYDYYVLRNHATSSPIYLMTN